MNDKDLLRLIEHIVDEHDEKENESPDGLLLMRIYKAVHSHRQDHSCYHVHKDWREESEAELEDYSPNPSGPAELDKLKNG